MNFSDYLIQRFQETKSLLCIGLDPNLNTTDPLVLKRRIKRVIDLTSQYALAFKANTAFYEQYGIEGYKILSELRNWIPVEIPLIIDAKRGDVGHTANAYCKSIFDKLGADATTVSGYFGSDCIIPFANYSAKGVFVLAKTSNDSSYEMQDLNVVDGQPVYLKQALLAKQLNVKGNIGIVVGATQSRELALLRYHCPNMWILAPGIGTQQGSLELTLKYGYVKNNGLIMVNVSRSIFNADNPDEVAKNYYNRILSIISEL